MPLLSYPAVLAQHADRRPDDVALVCDEREVGFSELQQRSNRLARDFESRGVCHGDFVTLALPNGVAFVESCFAAWKLGAIPQPVSARLPDRERFAILEHARPALVVGVEAAGAAGFPSLPVGFEPGDFSDASLPDRVSPARQALASGGSTGQPKLIVDVLPAECDPSQPFYGNEPGTTVLVPGPLYHAAGFVNLTTTLLLGGRAILMSRFDAEQALALIERQAVEWVSFVPTMLQRIWRLPEETRRRFDVGSLRRVVSSGAPCPPWLMREWIGWLGAERVAEAYGGTERIGGTFITGSEWLEHPGSVGRPTGGRKLRVLDDSGSEVPAGEVGEVFMLPPGGQGSTYRYVGASARSDGEGWETLGDLGYLDEDGYLYLSDRRTDMIVTAGENVYPAEVEAALLAHPSVHSCAVIGLPDEDLGQRVHAIVEARPVVDEETLRAHLADQLLRYKAPRSFEFVDAPLRDEAGKLRRGALRAARLGTA
ncbi:MAG: AMP-binding protein [Myxococcota bacterium]